jgi:hypothetical protein
MGTKDLSKNGCRHIRRSSRYGSGIEDRPQRLPMNYVRELVQCIYS